MPMETTSEEPQPKDLLFADYAVSFIDLLGQRAAYANQGLMPACEDEESRNVFIDQVRKSVGVITRLHIRAEAFSRAANDHVASPMRASLPKDKQLLWDRILETRVITQRWSDGLVEAVRLADHSIVWPVSGVWRMLTQAGSFCLIGLADKQPLRGGIEVAWATELNPGEIYGAAVVRAYELESTVAQWPRIVVGPLLIDYLSEISGLRSQNVFHQANAQLANRCLKLLRRSEDSEWEIDYLGNMFQRSVTQDHHEQLVRDGKAFVDAQIETFRSAGDERLARRYEILGRYFQQSIAP